MSLAVVVDANSYISLLEAGRRRDLLNFASLSRQSEELMTC